MAGETDAHPMLSGAYADRSPGRLVADHEPGLP